MSAAPPASRIVLSAGDWSGDAADTVTLDYDQRHRRRIAMEGNSGLAFLLDLPEPVQMRNGDGLRLDDGRVVRVEAAEELLTEITATSAVALTRIGWHLGNRHTPTAITEATLIIRRDHVLEEMIIGLGGIVNPVLGPFDPEGGAYERHH